jgi:hypothetical protein
VIRASTARAVVDSPSGSSGLELARRAGKRDLSGAAGSEIGIVVLSSAPDQRSRGRSGDRHFSRPAIL